MSNEAISREEAAKSIVNAWAIETLQVDLDYVTDQMREDFNDLVKRIAALSPPADAPTPEMIVYQVAQRDPSFRRHLIEQLTALGDKQAQGPLKALASPPADDERIRGILKSSERAVLGINGGLREILARWTHPCLDPCGHGVCPLLREIGALVWNSENVAQYANVSKSAPPADAVGMRRLALEIGAHCAMHHDDTPSGVVVDWIESRISAALAAHNSRPSEDDGPEHSG